MIDLVDGIDINKGDFAYFSGHFVDDKFLTTQAWPGTRVSQAPF